MSDSGAISLGWSLAAAAVLGGLALMVALFVANATPSNTGSGEDTETEGDLEDWCGWEDHRQWIDDSGDHRSQLWDAVTDEELQRLLWAEHGPGPYSDEAVAGIRRTISLNSKAKDLECLVPGEAVVVVEGLPDVSGVYRTADGDTGVLGWAATELYNPDSGQAPPHTNEIGTCFVNKENLGFQTKAVHIAGAEDPDNEDEAVARVTTIDVGVTAIGQPFAAVIREFGAADAQPNLEGQERFQPGATFVVTHVYEPALYKANAQVDVGTGLMDGEDYSGVAVFSSTSYNNRDWSPWHDDEWKGDPLHEFTITVFCRSTATAPETTTTTEGDLTFAAGSITVGGEESVFTFTGDPGEVCDPDENGAFHVEMTGEDSAGEPVLLTVIGPATGGFAIVTIGPASGEGEVWVADLNQAGNSAGLPNNVGASAEVNGPAVSGNGVFYEQSALDEANANRTQYEGEVVEGNFHVDCSGQ